MSAPLSAERRSALRRLLMEAIQDDYECIGGHVSIHMTEGDERLTYWIMEHRRDVLALLDAADQAAAWRRRAEAAERVVRAAEQFRNVQLRYALPEDRRGAAMATLFVALQEYADRATPPAMTAEGEGSE